MQLEENTILITGGTSGIGLALAGLLQKQNTVIVCGRNPKHIEKTRGLYPRLHVWTCDLADSNSRARLAERVQREFPELNLLINNAGIQHTLDFTEPANHCALITEEITINLTAQIDLVDRLLPLLLSRPAAAVVNITSALALTPKQSAPVYCATKAAMRNFTRALRYQLDKIITC